MFLLIDLIYYFLFPFSHGERCSFFVGVAGQGYCRAGMRSGHFVPRGVIERQVAKQAVGVLQASR
jgi:hypothetical protein